VLVPDKAAQTVPELIQHVVSKQSQRIAPKPPTRGGGHPRNTDTCTFPLNYLVFICSTSDLKVVLCLKKNSFFGAKLRIQYFRLFKIFVHLFNRILKLFWIKILVKTYDLVVHSSEILINIRQKVLIEHSNN
jgi:hypothetical protein